MIHTINGCEYNPGWRPALHQVLVFPVQVEEISAGGIALPADVTKRDQLGQIEALVISIGPTAWKDQKIDKVVELGDRVLFSKYAGYLVKGADGKDYRLISDLDIVGVHE